MSSFDIPLRPNKKLAQLKRVANSTFEPVSVQRAKHNSNIPDGEKAFDSFLADCIQSARDYIERQLGCCICEAAYTLTLSEFPIYGIDVPVWPVQSVESIAYKDTANANQTITLGDIVQPVNDDRYTIYLNDWTAFPTAKTTPNAITVSFTAGWPTQAAIPPAISRAMLMLVSHWFENRESVLVGQTSKDLEFAVNALLEAVRPGEDNLE
jgi:uncharacterized phiE125 gp8 family phage protein